MMGRALAVLLAIGCGGPAAALELPAELAATERGRVAAIADGGTFALEDGRTVRLAGLHVPRPGGPDERTGRRQIVAKAAQDVLSALLGPAPVTFAPAGPADRYGRIPAHVADGQGRWIQAEMVARGYGRVTFETDGSAGARQLLALEAEARAARRGLWALPEFRVIGIEEAARHLDTFQIVEGRVRIVERKSGRTYLNFGEDWRSDFTVTIEARLRKRLAGAGLDPDEYRGKMVRVRGWIESRNGPHITLAQPEQIEVIAE
jgi:endonuclease YncB( thermonuclease family)